MQFNPYSYALFLLLAVAMFWSLPARVRRVYVLIASLVFYASWGIALVILPIVISTVTYWCAAWMVREPGKKNLGLSLGITFALALLGYFKYRLFLATLLTSLFGWRWSGLEGSMAILLPLGISFYTFEAVSYLLDVRQGRVKEVRYLDLLLFVLFWPHLMAGPIVRVRELVPQLSFDKAFDGEFFTQGMSRIMVGLVQKNVFANSLGGWVDEGFVAKIARANSTLDAWALAVAFGLQIYFDFAAYSNIAIGSATLIGVKLPENFNCPYWAANPAEFWAAIGNRIKPSLLLSVTVSLKAFDTTTYPSVITSEIRLESLADGAVLDAPFFRIGGVVLDNASQPVANAGVRLVERGRSTLTDAEGKFSLSAIPAGNFTLRVTAGAVTQDRAVVVPATAVAGYDVQLT